MSDFRLTCEHVCHRRGLNPWIEFCPVCQCANPTFDPAAESDIEPLEGMELGGALGLLLLASGGK